MPSRESGKRVLGYRGEYGTAGGVLRRSDCGHHHHSGAGTEGSREGWMGWASPGMANGVPVPADVCADRHLLGEPPLPDGRSKFRNACNAVG